MTGCIVGWAHTPFGRLDGETVESLIVRVANGALADAGIEAARRRRDRARPLQRGLLGAGFHRLAGAAGLAGSALQAGAAGGKRLRDRFRGRASGAEVDRGQGGARRAGGRRRADDHDARPRDRKKPVESLLRARGGRHRGRLCRDFRQDRRTLFPALGRPVRRARHDRGQEPQERRRQSLRATAQGPGLRVLPQRQREESVRRGPAQAHRLLAGVRRRRGAGAGRRRDRAAARQGDRVPLDRACAGFPADDASATSSSSRAAPRPGSGRSPTPASRSAIFRWSRPTTASPSPS